MKTALWFACFGVMTLPIIGSASVTLNIGAGKLYGTSTSTVCADGRLIQLVSAGVDGSFSPPSAYSFISGDDVLLGSYAVSSATTGTAGATLAPLTLNYASLGVAAGQRIALRWYPSIVLGGSAPGSAVAYGQFSSTSVLDGSDIAWTLPADGSAVALYFLTLAAGGTNAESTGVASLVCSTARIASDFNNDGKSDLVWENTTTGQRYIWLMNGTGFTSGINMGTLSTQWHIASTADFNSDGKPDLVWENTTTGDRYVWLMNGTTFTSSIYLGNLSIQWRIAGTGDFNSDGKSDLVWENTTTGDRYIWLMNGTVFTSSIYLGNMATQWRIAATGDFNGDGKTDLVWENTTSGDRYIWLMNGSTFASSAYIGNAPIAWRIAGAGDFNSNGQTDILWENTTTGERGLWLMSGTSFSSWVSLGVVPTAWRVRN